jgi:hypothetical protein
MEHSIDPRAIRMGDYLETSKRHMRRSLWLFITWIGLGLVSWSFLRVYVRETNIGVVMWEAIHIVFLIPSIVFFVLGKVSAQRGRESFFEKVRETHFTNGPLGKRSFFELVGADPSALSRYGFDTEKSEFTIDDYIQTFAMIRKYEKFNKFDLKDAE